MLTWNIYIEEVSIVTAKSYLHRKYQEISVSSLAKQLCYILLSELTNCCLNYIINNCDEGECSKSKPPNEVLSNKDVNCLEYIAGYCFRHLYCRIRKEQRLVGSRNRGGQ